MLVLGRKNTMSIERIMRREPAWETHRRLLWMAFYNSWDLRDEYLLARQRDEDRMVIKRMKWKESWPVWEDEKRQLQLELLREKSGQDDAGEENEFKSCRILMALSRFRRKEVRMSFKDTALTLFRECVLVGSKSGS